MSFPVYQETADEPVWSVLGGDKDDVFIYDRCGRLAYFIPFPLSVTLPGRHPVVEEALNTTYYSSPCGDLCPEGPGVSQQGHSQPELGGEGDAAGGIERRRLPGEVQARNTGELGNALTPPTTSSEGLGWRVIHMVFGDGHYDRAVPSTPSPAQEGRVATRAPHEHRGGRPTPAECASIGKATCFDWPKERIRHVESCCNHTARSRSYHFRHSCRRLTRRQCKKLHHVFLCCKLLHENLDRQISREFEGIESLIDGDLPAEGDGSRAVTAMAGGGV